VTNSTISGNSASFGGGIDNIGTVGVATVTNSTISGNSASSSGGGIFNINGVATLRSTIVANSPTGGDCFNTSGTITSGGYNLIGDTTCSTVFTQTGDITNTNPLLGPLQNNGGPIPTETHALIPPSPAIDWVPDATCPSADQRGFARGNDIFMVGNETPSNALCDIGAYER
jgi:hypothetical protein